MTKPRFAELFAGAGGMTLGLEAAGWESSWHAEIADAPRAILAHHWPHVPLLGDVTTLDGAALVALHGPIDLLCGGSPCQDLSVAGKRAGMTEGSGTRSSLFFEQMRLWHETGADLCLWENVDGARSSNDGKDFGAVLRAFVGAAVPVPSDGWRSAGVAAGPRGVAAWRVLDAQFFGVPQRRRRVFVLGTRTGSVDPAEVLSLTESLRGDTPPSREAGEGVAGRADGGPEQTRRIADTITANYGKQIDSRDSSKGPPNLILDALNSTSSDMVFTLQAGAQHGVACYPLDARQYRRGDKFTKSGRGGGEFSGAPGVGIGNEGDPSYTLGQVTPSVIAFGHQNSAAQGASASATCTPALDQSKVPAVLAVDFAQITSKDNRSQPQPLAPTLNAKGDVHVFNETGHEKWTEEEIAGSLNAHEAREAREAREAHTIVADQDYASVISPPLVPGDHAGSYNGMVTAAIADAIQKAEVASTLNGSQRQQVDGAMTAQLSIPRRLTPRECERLMGWPDNHTLVPDAKGKLLSDAARYKACGNGVASPVAEWIGERLRIALEESPTPSAVQNSSSGPSGVGAD